MEKKLTARQHRFVMEYLKGNTLAQAAINAGYSKKCAYVQGSKLLREPHIRDEVARQGKDIKGADEADIEEIRSFWTSTMRGIEESDETGNFGVIKNAKPAIAQRLKASEMLARSKGIFTDKIEHSGSDITVTIAGENINDENQSTDS